MEATKRGGFGQVKDLGAGRGGENTPKEVGESGWKWYLVAGVWFQFHFFNNFLVTTSSPTFSRTR